MAPNENAYRFCLYLPPNTFRLQSSLRGSKRKLKWLVQGGNYRTHHSTLPRLLTSVYKPLSRCATASDACNLACGLRTKQTGSRFQVPRFAFLGRSKSTTQFSGLKSTSPEFPDFLAQVRRRQRPSRSSAWSKPPCRGWQDLRRHAKFSARLSFPLGMGLSCARGIQTGSGRWCVL